LHGPTQRVLKDAQRARLLQAGVELADLSRHQEFVKALAEAPFVITDGGSIQEECALLGVPTLLWRRRTDRRDGIGRNVILSRYEPAVVSQFLANPQCHRTESSLSAVQPSAEILEALLAR